MSAVAKADVTKIGAGSAAVEDLPDAQDSCLDVDAHEMIPTHRWAEEFGDGGTLWLDLAEGYDIFGNSAENSLRRDEVVADAAAITEDTVWSIRGADAPSAMDLGRRTAVLDTMGIARQLVFPTFALAGLHVYFNPQAHVYFGYDPTKVDRMALGHRVVRSHNDWCVRVGNEIGNDRVRLVGVILTDDLDHMISEAQRLIAAGVRCFQIPSGTPPAGMSPGHVELDPFWKTFTDSDVPVTLHVGTEYPLLASQAWDVGVPQFENSKNSSLEFPIQPYWGATLNFASENFLTAMVLGGVFERHPTLRFGVIENGAQWIGPLAERLDLWATEFKKRLDPYLSLRPSEYLNRNVRVGPFHFEDVASYFERYPHLADVYCYSSDFPHREGGRWSKRTFAEKLRDASDDVRDRFFRRNAELLLPA